MEECEVCGKEAKSLFLVEIEGAQMIVCTRCSKGKAILKEYKGEEKAVQAGQHVSQREEDTVIENYGNAIRKARDRLGLPLKVLAERINEKESTLVRIEKAEMLPEDKIARKLEKALGIQLVEKQAVEGKRYQGQKSESLTLGDAAMLEDKSDEGN
jgi:putative transcription factor